MEMQEIDMREALRQAIDEEMGRDEAVFLMGEEVGKYNGAYKISKGLLDKYGPKRIIDTPISESGFTGIGIGAAMTGLRPIIEFMSFNFSFVGCDQIISNAAKMYYMSGGRFNVPIVFRGPNGAAAQVSCQHSHCVESMYALFPGLKVISPYTCYDAKGLLKAAIRDNNPVLFLENEMLYGVKQEIPIKEYLVEIGKAQVLKKGTDITLISHNRMLDWCLQASNELLNEHGINVEIIDLRTIKPLDIATIIESVKKTHFCCLVEEGHYFSGLSAEIGFQIQERVFDYLDAPIKRVCQKESPMPYSKVLEHATLPNKDRIKQAILEVLM
jgi:pyruvate dehydrogenase E1 component beta subunit